MTSPLYSGATYAEAMVAWLPYKLEQLGLAHLLNDGPFADLGCGLGTVIATFQQKYPHIRFIGIDRNRECLDEARKIVSPDTLLIQASLRAISLRDNSLAVVFSHKIYQLCNEETYAEIAKEIHRTLRTGGVYFASEPMIDYKRPFLELGLVPMYEKESIIFKK
ncbi:MAG TPA: class I SAM-dependent methyltransferase [Candidatus Nanoarchaeia archaeon]|nr:class I SAM-dependent methyltransferase [Candidatus Nanoarchaeia archaeon]